MPIEVELLGVARLLARREVILLPVERELCLSELLSSLGTELPALVGTVLTTDGALLGGHVLSRNGTDLIREPAETLRPGDRLFLLSTAAGG